MLTFNQPDLPDVLHNITFTVNPGEKIGILGRTGSGKSTLALSFFRFVEATEGRIVVDGVDIAKIGLTDLRSRLTIIPRTHTLLYFSAIEVDDSCLRGSDNPQRNIAINLGRV